VIQKTAGATSEPISSTADLLLWYARDRERVKFRSLFTDKLKSEGIDRYDQVELSDGARRPMTADEKGSQALLPVGLDDFSSAL
jgi:adenine-specific DNA-methyltransferase